MMGRELPFAAGPRSKDQLNPETLALMQAGRIGRSNDPPAQGGRAGDTISGADRNTGIAVTFLGIAIILAASSLALPWWQEYGGYSCPSGDFCPYSGGSGFAADFYPGTMWSCQSSCGLSFDGSGPGSHTYASAGLSHVGLIYQGIGLAVPVSLLLGGAAFSLSIVGALGRPFGRTSIRVAVGLAVLASATIIGIAAFDAIVQPLALQADGAVGRLTTNPLPAGPFWGHAQSAGWDAWWGAGLGWFVALAAAILDVASAELLVRTHGALVDTRSISHPRKGVDPIDAVLFPEEL